jgi:hypothetical protein
MCRKSCFSGMEAEVEAEAEAEVEAEALRGVKKKRETR